MDMTFDVLIWSIREKIRPSTTTGKARRKSYVVRWRVGKDCHSKTYGTRALADSFRSQLVSAQKAGEAFRLIDGLPVSVGREGSNRAGSSSLKAMSI